MKIERRTKFLAAKGVLDAMAYKMRYRVVSYMMNPQDTGGDNEAPIAGETKTFDVGSYEAANPTSVVIYSLSRAVSAIMSVNNRVQRGLLTNMRFEVFGKPVGTPENPDYDLTADMKEERLYLTGDTPNPALLVGLALANKKPSQPSASAIQFAPTDVIPEGHEGAEPLG